MTTDHMIQSENSLGYVRVKHAESPKYLIEEFSVTEADSFYFNQRCQAQNLSAQCIRPGIYVHLLDKQKDEVVMSNIPAEIYDHTEICQKSYGWVLICGLGLGMILHQLCRNDHISEIVVVEKEPEIINMIAPAFPEGKVTILQGDAFLPEGVPVSQASSIPYSLIFGTTLLHRPIPKCRHYLLSGRIGSRRESRFSTGEKNQPKKRRDSRSSIVRKKR